MSNNNEEFVDTWPTSASGWYRNLQEFVFIMNHVKGKPWWTQDPDLKYLDIRMDSRDMCFILSIIPRGGSESKPERISPIRVIRAIHFYNTKNLPGEES